MITTVIGKIVGATSTENFQGRDGQNVTKCTIVEKTIEAFPQTLAMTASGEPPWALQVEKNVEVSVGMTSRSFLVHVKVPIGMEEMDVEDLLDDEMNNATEIIMKKKEEMGCSIL